MNVYAVCEWTRFDEYESSGIMIRSVALTSDAAEKEVRRCAEAYVERQAPRLLSIKGEGLNLSIDDMGTVYFYAEEVPLVQ